MLILENIRMAFHALFANKMRSFLTMLGIIIGIGSVIAIMTVSASLTTAISDSFQEMGAGNITVGIKQKTEDEEVRENGMRFGTSGRSASVEEEDRITDDMLEELKGTFAERIDAVSVSEEVGSATVENRDASANISLMGVNTDYFVQKQVTLLAGRRITQEDMDGKKRVVMVSNKVIEAVFDGDTTAALHQGISLNLDGTYVTYYVVGVYEYEENSNFTSSSDADLVTTAYIPLTTGKEQIHADAGYTQFTVVTAAGISDVSGFADEIAASMDSYYKNNETYELQTATMESVTDSMNEMIQTVSIAIAFIAGISLLVGGIGVMNIMLISITERTKEIGTRKALGAKNSSIRLQFIVESVILCLAGGIFGILLGLVSGAVMAEKLGYSATAPLGAVVLAVLFSMGIGVFFGYYPAGKAARLNPIDALRYGF